MTYALSAQLAAHAADVRSVAAARVDGHELILSGSRDRTARLWVRRDTHFDSAVLGEAEGYINAVAFATVGATYALTGGQDGLVNAYDVCVTNSEVKSTSVPRYTLIGHTGNVSALAAYRDEYIVSGSWDTTAIVWRDWQPAVTLRGHAQAVWAVLPVDSDRILTASADKTVCLWSIHAPDTPIAIFTGATFPVRGLTALGDHFAAAGNDGIIRIYPLNATGSVAPTATLSGSPSFVYALAAEGSMVFSSGEERALRVWTDGRLSQKLHVPAESVWSVAALGADVVCGSSDGVVRIFSCDPARTADPATLSAYADTVAAQTVSSAEVEGIPVVEEGALGDAPEGTQQVVKSLSETAVYERIGGAWMRVGLVADTAPTQKAMHNGREYDHVFDVDVQDGMPPLKLAYNVSENPYVAAQRFLTENELPGTYLEQVVGFLEKNTSAVRLAPTAADPFTGDSGLQSTPRMPSSAGSIIPQTAHLSFTNANFAAAAKRIAQLRESLPMSATEQQSIDALIAALEGGRVADTRDAAHVARTWPADARLPLLDILRIAAARVPAGNVAALVSDLLIAAEWDAPGASAADDTNAMLALRGLANAFSAPGGASVLVGMALETLATLQSGRFARLGKGGRVAFATVLYNFSVEALHGLKQDSLLLGLIDEVLVMEPGESEAVYRALVALGNLLYASPRIAQAATGAVDHALAWKQRLPEARIDSILGDINKFATGQ